MAHMFSNIDDLYEQYTIASVFLTSFSLISLPWTRSIDRAVIVIECLQQSYYVESDGWRFRHPTTTYLTGAPHTQLCTPQIGAGMD